MTNRILLSLSLLLLFQASSSAEDPKAFPGTATKWSGFAKYDFKVGDKEATVVVPEKALPGRPWVWRGEFFGAFADADVALVKAGWHLAYLKVPDLFGSPKALQAWEKFYTTMVQEYAMHPKPGFIGLSRGGLYCMNWAATHPNKTLAVYLDNAVCDFKSWPGGKPKNLGAGQGSPGEWKNLLSAYDFKSDQEAISYKLNPVDNLAPLAKSQIPLLLVFGDKDTAVPGKENSELVYDRYKALGGPVTKIVKPGQDHHPHGLVDVSPVVRFFTRALLGDNSMAVREEIEWMDVWVPGNSNKDLPRVLLIGDSIVRAYYKEVEDRLKGKAVICRLSTAKSLGDPSYLDEVKLVLSQTHYDVVHFNNGLHGFGYTEEEYTSALPELLKVIRTNAPDAKLIWASTTAVRVADKLDTLSSTTERVKKRNANAKKLMDQESILVDDLYGVVISNAEYYSKDGVHMNGKGNSALGAKVAEALLPLLTKKE